MAIDLFAGIPVSDYAAALSWYEQLLGSPPTFVPNADRGLEPTKRETYSNGVRKATYVDPDGNEIGYGGAPSDGT
jgi:hypothetical protein